MKMDIKDLADFDRKMGVDYEELGENITPELNHIYEGDCLELMKMLPDKYFDLLITDPPYELNFMGKGWDKTGIANDVNMWKEALRVLKPGGYLLSFGGTRTYHRMTCGIEDAGFEIRDCIMWIYGSGFPKSLNIGKQIDKIQGNEREVVGKYQHPDGNKRNCKLGQNENCYGKYGAIDFEHSIDKGTSEWEGWGTALKPAVEPIVVARKPLSEKNVALNVLKWGTGGINIDESRVGTDGGSINEGEPNYKNNVYGEGLGGLKTTSNNIGRFPANVIFDEEAGQMLDEQSGVSNSKQSLMGMGLDTDDTIYGKGNPDFKSIRGHNDKGGASRFFYCAKASKSERNFGLDGSIPIKKNNHPTVKPISLIEYLIKLVSREGSIILDPFLGSGTTAVACLKLNRKFIGIEKEPDYVKIAEERIKPYVEQTKLGGLRK
jgi:site-specific DNA-methyltransferase (adenine-specific)